MDNMNKKMKFDESESKMPVRALRQNSSGTAGRIQGTISLATNPIYPKISTGCEMNIKIIATVEHSQEIYQYVGNITIILPAADDGGLTPELVRPEFKLIDQPLDSGWGFSKWTHGRIKFRHLSKQFTALSFYEIYFLLAYCVTDAVNIILQLPAFNTRIIPIQLDIQLINHVAGMWQIKLAVRFG